MTRINRDSSQSVAQAPGASSLRLARRKADVTRLDGDGTPLLRAKVPSMEVTIFVHGKRWFLAQDPRDGRLRPANAAIAESAATWSRSRQRREPASPWNDLIQRSSI